ncbi:MAG: phosphoenolpyruvate carboxykinase (ATP) [Gemmataceae bacterium]
MPPLSTDLAELGLTHPGSVAYGLAPAALVEAALARGEGTLTDRGAFVAVTGVRTGRSPQDRYIVREPLSKGKVDWGKVNIPLAEDTFDRLLAKTTAYLQNRPLFVVDAAAGADPKYQIGVRVIAEKAWHALFSANLFLPSEWGRSPEWTVLAAPDLHGDPARDGIRSEAFIVTHLARRIVLVGGTHYAGEIKKAIFGILNYLLPDAGVFPMHCSANVGRAGDVALFFGLSGTGKTTLSADPSRRLIGDDEHGWSSDGVFNFEGGCYAKTIRLSRTGEPQIWDALRFGSVLENVPVDASTRQPDFDSEFITENTRAAYPVSFISGAELTGRGGHPSNVLFLACDAFGVLPPLAKLSTDQAAFHFLNGYTAKVAGTEAGVTEPEATFSTCFAAPFLPLPARRYAELLREKLEFHRPGVWLVNTGWTGGVPGVGHRISLAHTRALVTAAIGGALDHVAFEPDPVFGVSVPTTCPGVPVEVLSPRLAWKDATAYDARATELAARFHDNHRKFA